jgi:hypothetical protein
MKAFRHYVNLHRTEERLVRLLRDFPMATLSESFAHWQQHGLLQNWDLRAAA